MFGGWLDSNDLTVQTQLAWPTTEVKSAACRTAAAARQRANSVKQAVQRSRCWSASLVLQVRTEQQMPARVAAGLQEVGVAAGLQAAASIPLARAASEGAEPATSFFPRLRKAMSATVAAWVARLCLRIEPALVATLFALVPGAKAADDRHCREALTGERALLPDEGTPAIQSCCHDAADQPAAGCPRCW